MDEAADEVKDFKRAHCEVMALTNSRLEALHAAIAACALPLWLIAIVLAVGLWRHW
jgi:choline-glycine betaine transporter